MTVAQLITELSKCDQDKQVVIQLGHGDGFFSLHDLVVRTDGHVGYSGPIISAGEQTSVDSEDRQPYAHPALGAPYGKT